MDAREARRLGKCGFENQWKRELREDDSSTVIVCGLAIIFQCDELVVEHEERVMEMFFVFAGDKMAAILRRKTSGAKRTSVGGLMLTLVVTGVVLLR